jgi:hypothetical protein
MGPGSVVRDGLKGLALGAAWGVAARVWMRLISDNPEFSWSGTLFIVGLSALFGGFTLAAATALRQGRSGWWRLLAVPGLLVFASQGAAFFPGGLVAAVGLSRRSWPGRAVAALAVLVVPVLLWRQFRLDDVTMLPASDRAQVAMLVGMPLLGLAQAWLARDLFVTARSRTRWAQSPSPDRARSSRRSESSLAAPAGPA